MTMYHHENNTKRYFSEIALALSLLIGSFSLFSVSFGLQKNHIFSFDTSSNYEYAKKSYGLQKRGPSVSQPFFESEREERGTYHLQHLEELRNISAQSFLVADLDTGEIIFERKPLKPYPIASVTKYMTAVTAAQFLKPNELVHINDAALRLILKRETP